MAERLFRVDELAQLCGVDPETVRRWRNKGVRGVYLESTDSSLLRGKNLLFKVQAVREFAEAYPKMMTPALKKELEKAESAQWDSVSCTEQAAASAAVLDGADNEFIMRLLLEKRAALLQELEQTEKSITRLKGGE